MCETDYRHNDKTLRSNSLIIKSAFGQLQYPLSHVKIHWVDEVPDGTGASVKFNEVLLDRAFAKGYRMLASTSLIRKDFDRPQDLKDLIKKDRVPGLSPLMKFYDYLTHAFKWTEPELYGEKDWFQKLHRNAKTSRAVEKARIENMLKAKDSSDLVACNDVISDSTVPEQFVKFHGKLIQSLHTLEFELCPESVGVFLAKATAAGVLASVMEFLIVDLALKVAVLNAWNPSGWTMAAIGSIGYAFLKRHDEVHKKQYTSYSDFMEDAIISLDSSGSKVAHSCQGDEV